MEGKKIMLGVTGGIAAFKAASLVSQLVQRGASVYVLMTQSATEFITPLTMQALSRHSVGVGLFEENDPSVISHIDLADRADVFVIAPATANTIAKMARGLSDDLISTALLATKAPIVVVPAMNVNMYEHPAVQENLQIIKSRGVDVIEPEAGYLACGHLGQGRMVEVEGIIQWLDDFFSDHSPLRGRKVLITAGPTIEKLDPVRYFSNFSSGKMGYELARAASRAGAHVTLVSGPVSLETPPKVTRIDIQSAEEMRQAVMRYLPQADIIIKAAAVADYRPQQISNQKIKKRSNLLEISLEKTIDIAEEIGRRKEPQQFFMGFAAETENMEKYALLKRKNKGMDLIVANDVSEPGSGFNVDTNRVTVYDETGAILSLPKMTKSAVSERIIQLIGDRIHGKMQYC